MYPFPYDRILVPYLGYDLDECGEHNFESYPFQHDVAPVDLRKRGAGHSPQELRTIAALLQQWLVFGLMRTLLGPSNITININDFLIEADQNNADSLPIDNAKSSPARENLDEDDTVRSAEGGDKIDAYHNGDASYDGDSALLDGEGAAQSRCHDFEEPLPDHRSLLVDTGYIIRYLVYLRAKEYFIDDAARQASLRDQHVSIFDTAEAALQELILWRTESYPVEDFAVADPPLVDSVILSIILSTEYLYETFMGIFSSLDGTARRHLDCPLDNALRQRLSMSGWCPGEVRVLTYQQLPTRYG